MSGPWEKYQTGPWTQYAEPVKQETPKEEGFFSNVGELLVEGGKRAIGAAKISPSVISGDVGGEQAKVLSQQLAMKPSVQPKELVEAQTAFKDEAEAFEKAEGFLESVGPFADFMLEFGKQVVTNPKGAIYLTAQSAANMAPQIAGMIAGGKAGAAIGAPGGPGFSAFGAGVGAVGGGFAASVPLEVGSEFISLIGQELSQRGLEPTEQNVAALLKDKKVVEKAISDARTKGVTTAAVDAAITAGAGRFAAGPRRAAIDAARKEMGATADAAKIAARAEEILKSGRTVVKNGATTVTSKIPSRVTRGAGAVGIETAGGGISEAAGQAAAYGKVDLEDVGAEMLGELGGSTLSIPSAAYATTTNALKRPAAKTPAAPAPATPVEPTLDVEPVTEEAVIDAEELPPALTEKGEQPATPVEPSFTPQSTATTVVERDGETTETTIPATETAKQRFNRLAGMAGKMANAFRDKLITNQEYDKFRSDLANARVESISEEPDELSPAKMEMLEIADKLEAAGVTDFAEGMRSAVQSKREPDEAGMEFYRSKLQPFEKKETPVESKAYGLPEFFADNEKDSARISEQLKSGPLKTRIALNEANDTIQRLAQTIQAAGFDVNNLVQGQVPAGIMNIKRQISNVAARAGRLANAAEAVQKKYKRANPERVKSDISGLMSDVAEANNLIDEDRPLPLLAEEMEGVPAPVSPEVDELLEKQRLAVEDIQILSKRTQGTSLMKVLQGSLNDAEMSELAGKDRRVGKNPFISLVAKKGSRGLPMEDMVDLRKLDLFLPIQMQPGQPNYDNAESAEYIREQLRSGKFYTDETQNEINRIQSGIWDIEGQIKEELSLEEINREIQYAADEQRELDQEASPVAADGTFEAPEEGARAEERLTEAVTEETDQREPEDFLQAQTEQELREKQNEIDRLNKENERLNKEADRKAQADEQVESFVLTGSKRDVDEAEARGQQPMFSVQAGSSGYNINADDQRVEKELAGKSMMQVADWAVDNAPNAFAKVIAEKVRNRLRNFQRKGMTLDFSIQGGDTRVGVLKYARGVTNFKWGSDDKSTKISVTLNGAAIIDGQDGFPPGVQYNTILHELLHVATRPQFVFMSKEDPLRIQMQDLFNAVVKRFNADAKAGKLPPVMEKYYKRMNNVLENADELLAWGLTDRDVQEYFDDIKVGETSVLNRLIELMRKAIGLGKPYESALSRLVRTSDSLLDVDVDSIDAMMGKMGKQVGSEKKIPVLSAQESLFQREGAAPESDVRYQRENIAGQPVLAQWTTPTDTKLYGDTNKDDIIYSLQNKMIDLKRVVDAISTQIGKISSKWNPYLKEELFHGRTAKRTNDFLKRELRPLMQNMDERGVSIKDFEDYLHNRHAEDYNRHIAKIGGMQDGGSGIKTADAKAYLAGLTKEQRDDFEALAKQLDAINKGTREILVDSGLENRDTIDQWEETFPYYVPLKRDETKLDYAYTAGGLGTGQGFDVRGKFSRAATGSEKDVVNILANSAMQRERAIVKAEKNRVAQALFGLAIQSPNPEFWLPIDPMAEIDPSAAQDLLSFGLSQQDLDFLMKEPRQKVVDKKSGEIVERINATLRNNENVMSMRFNGRDRYVFFNPSNPRSARMAGALKNLDADQLGYILGNISKLTRWFAAVNTQYNPIFGAYNFLRDVQSATLQLSDTPLAKDKKAVAAGTLPALKGIYTALRAERDGTQVSTPWAQLWNEFQSEGGQTGFRDQFSRSQERQEALQKELNMISEGKLKSAGRGILNLLSDYNDTMENAVRLSAYKAALDRGIDKEEAASIAKNLTVNFNRKGQMAVQAGALYAFFNAAVQGTTRLAQTLQGPARKKIIGGGLLLGAIQAALFAGAGFDEDEPPEFVRERNFIIPIGDGKYLAFPMPLGYHVIPNTSRIITEWALSGFKDTPDQIASLTSVLFEAFNPMGNAGWSAQTLSPTFADPIVALTENRDWTGKPIARKDFSNLDPTPGYTRAKDTASWFSTQLTKFLNYASGGTEFKPGVLSFTPDQIDYLIGQVAGGIGRELLKTEQTITSTITGEELPPYKIPLAGRFYGETKSSVAESGRFYKNLTKINEHENEIKGRRESKQPITEYLKENPEARLAPIGRKIYSNIQKLRKRKEKLLERKAPRESIKQVEDLITKQMQRFNDRVRALEEKKK